MWYVKMKEPWTSEKSQKCEQWTLLPGTMAQDLEKGNRAQIRSSAHCLASSSSAFIDHNLNITTTTSTMNIARKIACSVA